VRGGCEEGTSTNIEASGLVLYGYTCDIAKMHLGPAEEALVTFYVPVASNWYHPVIHLGEFTKEGEGRIGSRLVAHCEAP
jgi:hypothetical protein